jgi:hypothetical protein
MRDERGTDATASEASAMNEQAGHEAGWFPDPTDRYEYRWYNGRAWTGDVSVGGRRFVDPAPDWSAARAKDAPSTPDRPGRPLDRTLAVLAGIAGSLAVATAWMPVMVVVGVLAAVAAIVLGAVSLTRVAAGRAGGRGLARTGLALGIVGIALSPVGIVLTGRVVDEVRRFAEPGPVSVDISSCTVADGRVEVTGSIVNLGDTVSEYVIVVEMSDVRGRDDVVQIAVGGIEPDVRTTWSTTEASALTGVLRCSTEVTGPYPFGISPPARD